MILLPAIDLYNKKCVRLEKGKFDTVTSFSDDPIKVAKKYQAEGATWLHVIDLNGAETGDNTNKDIIKEILAQTDLKLEVGGGIRNKNQVIEYIDMGVSRVILGSFVIRSFEETKELITKYPDQIIVSVDSRDGFVTYKGWQETSSYKTIDFCKKLEEINVKTIVYTDISKDGMMVGPNFTDYQDIMNNTNLNVIASGGVSSYEDIIKLKRMNLYGAIIGKALYINKVTVKEMVKCLQNESSLA